MVLVKKKQEKRINRTKREEAKEQRKREKLKTDLFENDLLSKVKDSSGLPRCLEKKTEKRINTKK